MVLVVGIQSNLDIFLFTFCSFYNCLDNKGMGIKLANVKYSKSDKWYSPEYLPDTPRDILIYTEEGGTSEGFYKKGSWYVYKWNCNVEPLYWREIPRYENS